MFVYLQENYRFGKFFKNKDYYVQVGKLDNVLGFLAWVNIFIYKFGIKVKVFIINGVKKVEYMEFIEWFFCIERVLSFFLLLIDVSVGGFFIVIGWQVRL